MKTEYIQRRQKLVEQMKDNSLLLLFSGVGKVRSGDQTYDFDVNRNFYYLTGIEQEDSALMIIKSDGDERIYLFIQDKDENKEKWTGIRLSMNEAKEISGISNVLLINSLDAKLNAILSGNSMENYNISTVYLDLEKEQKIGEEKYTTTFAEELKNKYSSFEIEDFYKQIVALRMIKSPYEIECLKKAIKITKKGLERIWTISNPGLFEYNLKNNFEFVLAEHRSHVSFSTIIASGGNGVILHYPDAASELKANELVLCDLGATYKNYCADITRTFPVNGKFTPIQRQIYSIVLECNKAVINYAHPGITLLDLQNFAKEFLASELIERGLIQNKDDINRVYYHGVSHFLGLDTHDVSYDGKNVPLQPGNVITVEPGLYFKEYGIGIRVEDDVLITEEGAECLSPDIMKEIYEIEDFMRYRGE